MACPCLTASYQVHHSADLATRPVVSMRDRLCSGHLHAATVVVFLRLSLAEPASEGQVQTARTEVAA